MTTLIIDDEPLAVGLLQQYTERHPSLTLVGAYTSPIDGLAALQTQPPDLLLLDIQMAELNGLHLARLVRGRCAVVFTTAYEAHALAGFELDAVDYLLKPISYARFERAVEKVQAFRLPEGELPTFVAPASPPPVVFVKSGHRTVGVTVEDIRYASSAGDYLLLYLEDGSRVMTIENLGDLLARLPADQFCRIHRSHFVRVDKIEFVERNRVVIAGTWLPVSRAYKTALTARLGK